MSFNLSKREKILALIMILIFLTTGYYFLLYQPLTESKQQLLEEKNEKERQLIIERAMAKKAVELREIYQEFKNVERKMDALDLSAEDFLELLQDISKNSQAELVSFTPQQTETDLSLNLTMVGHYENIYFFLSGVKSLASQIEIDNLVLRPEEENIKMDLTITKLDNKPQF
ncbi:MAG: hypothetical protein ACOC2O_02600 [Bacillota bacterium]